MAEGVFPLDRLPRAAAYAELLATEGVLRGLIGPREVDRLWERHLLNCALLGSVIPQDASVCDLGSGAGLPGIVLGIARPDLRITLVEPLLRRTAFLDEVVDALDLDHVEVVRGRAEVLHGRRTFDVVTSRALAPLARLLEWSMPLVAPMGAVLAMKGSSAAVEVSEAEPVWRALGCAEPEVVQTDDGVSTGTVVRVAWADPSRVGSSPAAGTRRSSRERRQGRAKRKDRS